MMLFPDEFAVYAVIVGISLIIVGLPRWGIALCASVALHWIVWPELEPHINRLPAAILLIIFPLLFVLGAVLLLKYFITIVYGRDVGDQVAAVYVVRVLDRIGVVIKWLFSLLLRPFRRG